MPLTNDLTHSAAVNGWDTDIPGPLYEDWDFEIAMDPYLSGRLWDIDGQLIYMFDYQYEQYTINQQEAEEDASYQMKGTCSLGEKYHLNTAGEKFVFQTKVHDNRKHFLANHGQYFICLTRQVFDK